MKYALTFQPDGAPSAHFTLEAPTARDAIDAARAVHGGTRDQYRAEAEAWATAITDAKMRAAIATSARDRAFWRRAYDVARRAAAR